MADLRLNKKDLSPQVLGPLYRSQEKEWEGKPFQLEAIFLEIFL